MAEKTKKADIPTNMAGKPAETVDVAAMIDRLVKNAGEALGILGDGLGKVGALRRYRADQGNRALSAAEHVRTSASFVVFRQS